MEGKGGIEDGQQQAAKTVEDDSHIKKKGWALIVHDFKQKELIPIKLLSFIVLASLGVLLPYMTIHMKSLGITVSEIAIIYGVVPLFAILAPSTMGMIADKLGNFKVLLCVILLLKTAIALLFLAIPTGRFIDAYPANMSLGVSCSSPSGFQGLFMLTDLDSIECDFKPSAANNLTLTVEECGYLCLDSQTDRLQQQQVIKESLPADWPTADQPHHKFRNGLFFRDDWSVDVICLSNNNCTLTRTGWWEADNKKTKRATTFDQVQLKNLTENIFTVERLQQTAKVIQCDTEYDRPVRLIQPLTFKLNNSLKSDQGVLSFGSIDAVETAENEINYKICRPQCLVRAPRSDICSNKEHVVVFDPQLTFWLYMLLRLFFGILLGGGMTLFEGACLAVVTEVKGDLGVQRIFGLIGLMIFAPVSGALIDHFSIHTSITDFRPAFYLYAVLVTIAAIGVLFVNLEFKSPNTNLLKDIKSLLKIVELNVFFLVVFMSGLFWGYIESYLFLFLEDLGGTKSLMGLTITISCLVGIPPLLMSDKIFRKIGHPNVQVIGFAVYVIRLIGYSYIESPYMCLVYEVMEAITTALMTTSMMAYSAQLGTTQTLATIQGLIGAAYYGLGRGAGTFIGGFLMKWLGGGSLDKTTGTRATLRVLGVAALITGIVYFIFNIFFIRRRNAAAAAAAAAAKNKEEIQQVPHPSTVKEGGLNNPVFVTDEQQADAKANTKSD